MSQRTDSEEAVHNTKEKLKVQSTPEGTDADKSEKKKKKKKKPKDTTEGTGTHETTETSKKEKKSKSKRSSSKKNLSETEQMNSQPSTENQRESKPNVEDASVKIQSAFRGYRARKQLKESQQTENDNLTEEDKQKRKQEIDKQIEAAKLKMQKAEQDLQKMKQTEKPKQGFFDKIVAQFASSSSSSSSESEDEKGTKSVSDIGTPMNVKHEGHVGFDKKGGHFETRNLPPAIAKLFEEINHSLKLLGVDEITEKEAKLLLKALPVITDTQKAPKHAPKLSSKDRDSNSSFFHSVLHFGEDKTEKDILKHLQLDNDELHVKLDQEHHARLELQKKNEALEIKVLELEAKVSPSSSSDSGISKIKDKYETIIAEIREELAKEKENSQKLRKERDEALMKSTLPPANLPKPTPPPPVAVVEDIPPPPPEESVPDVPPPPPEHATTPTAPKTVVEKKEPKEVKKESKPTGGSGISMDEILKARAKMRSTNSTVALNNKDPSKPKPGDTNLASVIANAIVQRRQYIKETNEDENEDDNLADWL